MVNKSSLAEAFRMLYEVELEVEAEARRTGSPMTQVSMAIYNNPSSDRRRYNSPRMNEVAVVFQSAGGEPPYERDLIIYLRPNFTDDFPTTSTPQT